MRMYITRTNVNWENKSVVRLAQFNVFNDQTFKKIFREIRYERQKMVQRKIKYKYLYLHL